MARCTPTGWFAAELLLARSIGALQVIVRMLMIMMQETPVAFVLS
jgi:hypothetical protein